MMVLFLMAVMFGSFIVMCLNAERKREPWEFPAFVFAFVIFAMAALAWVKVELFPSVSPAETRELLWSNLWKILTVGVVYLVIGAQYALFAWRWRILPKIKADIQRRTQDDDSRFPEDSFMVRVRRDYFDMYYIPEGEDIVLPVLSYHAPHLIWLIHFWSVDLTRYVFGNGLHFVFVTMPKTLGTFVYHSIKAELERVARKVLK